MKIISTLVCENNNINVDLNFIAKMKIKSEESDIMSQESKVKLKPRTKSQECKVDSLKPKVLYR